MKRRTVLALCLCLTLAGTPVGVSAASDSLLSVTEEAQIHPIEDGSGKYIIKSDGFYCLKEDGSKDTAPAVHYFDHVNIDGTILDGFYYHDETGCYQAASPHMVKITKLTCAKRTDEKAETEDFDGYYMVNNLGKLTAAPQVRYISNYVIDNTTYDGYYYFDETWTDGDGTREHMKLEMTANGQMFSGTYYFGGPNGALLQQKAGTTPKTDFRWMRQARCTALDDARDRHAGTAA